MSVTATPAGAAGAGPRRLLARLRHDPAAAVSRRRGPASRRVTWRASGTTRRSAREGGRQMSPGLLEVTDLTVRFRQRGRDVPAVNGVSFTAWPGRTLAIVGESGSGKTVSCRAVMGLLPPSAVGTGSGPLPGND